MKTQLTSLQRNQTFLKILIFTLVTVIIWVGMTLFRTQRSSEISPELIRLSEPLNPNINLTVVERVEQKRSFSPEELADFPVYSLFVSKTGEEQLVIFSASDRSKRPLNGTPETPQQNPEAPTPVEPGEGESQGAVEQQQPEDQPVPEQPQQETQATPDQSTQEQFVAPPPPPEQPAPALNQSGQLDSPTGQF
jgi:hypothetical protein